jgi:regulation of enolase protein 1 (concanavalin A-like superfamily)
MKETDMRSRIRGARRGALATAAVALTAALGLAGATPASAAVDPPPAGWPEFGYQGVVTDKATMTYNPTDEYIFPSVFHAGAHFEHPLSEWYLYTAPHDDPGGIVLMLADSLEGPWRQYPGSPVVTNDWPPHYGPVPHVSSPDAVWNAAEGQMFLYFHGNNSVTRYATSRDGVTFEYGGEAVTNAMGDVPGRPRITESSYARVFDHPDPDSPYRFAMFYMANDSTPVSGGLTGIRRIRLAESVDGRTWVVDPTPVVEPGEEEGANVSGPNLWEHDGQLYVLYHASSGKAYARTIDRSLRTVGATPIVLHEASGLGTDVGRVASPEVVTDGEDTYLFYESGDRLGGTIKWAKDGAETVIDPAFGGFPADPADPVFASCAADGSDEFDGVLGPGWERTVRAEGARHAVVDGALVVPTYTGGVAAAPLLQQPLSDGAWQVTTKVALTPTQNFQQAGLLLYASDADYVKLDLGKASPGRVVEFVSAGTRPSTTQQRSDATEAWLRLTSDGREIEASVSYDGATFTTLGSRMSATTDAGAARFGYVGPYAFRGSTAAAEIPARFDWLRFSPSTEAYADCAAGGDPGNGPGTDPGADPGTDPGIDPGTDPGTAPVATTPPAPMNPGGGIPAAGQQAGGEWADVALSGGGRVEQGGSLRVTVTGLAPGQQIAATLFSDPIVVTGIPVADAQGRSGFTVRIPAGFDLGAHRLVITAAGEDPIQVGVTVIRPGALAVTGSTAPWGAALAGAALLVLGAGAGALVVRRRRLS